MYMYCNVLPSMIQQHDSALYKYFIEYISLLVYITTLTITFKHLHRFWELPGYFPF